MQGIAVTVGIGMMLLLAGQAMAAGTFTVGDFALFTYYLWFTTELPSYLGTFVGDIKQQEVAIGRLAELVPDEPDAVLVEPHPLEAAAADVMLNGTCRWCRCCEGPQSRSNLSHKHGIASGCRPRNDNRFE